MYTSFLYLYLFVLLITGYYIVVALSIELWRVLDFLWFLYYSLLWKVIQDEFAKDSVWQYSLDLTVSTSGLLIRGDCGKKSVSRKEYTKVILWIIIIELDI